MVAGPFRAAATLSAVCSLLIACSGGRETTTVAPAPRPVTGSVWVADEGANSLSVVDAATNSVVMTITGLGAPHNVQVGPGGSIVYATSAADVVVAIDPLTYRVTASAPAGPHPAHVIEAPNAKVYVTNAADGTVSVYRAGGLLPAGRITLGGMPHGLRAAAGGSVIVVANMTAGALDLIDPVTDRPMARVAVGKSPVQVAVSADGRYAYTGISEPPRIVKVDLMQRTVVGTARIADSPVQLYLTPDEATVLSADQGSRDAPGHTLSIIDTTTMKVRATVDTGSGPHGVVIDPSGARAWVTNSYDGTISAVDIADATLSATVPVGAGPNGISYSPRSPASAPAKETTIVVPGQSGHDGHH